MRFKIYLFYIYEDNNLSNGPEAIEWIVLDKEDDKVFVISKYCLENKPFNTTLAQVSWANSTIRKWLNSDFLNSAFSANERSLLRSTTIKNPDDADHERSLANTTDKIFLLSENEALTYFSSDSSRRASATEYCSTNHCYWILRTTGTYSNVAHVDYTGYVGYYENVDRQWWIRPAMWIELNK